MKILGRLYFSVSCVWVCMCVWSHVIFRMLHQHHHRRRRNFYTGKNSDKKSTFKWWWWFPSNTIRNPITLCSRLSWRQKWKQMKILSSSITWSGTQFRIISTLTTPASKLIVSIAEDHRHDKNIEIITHFPLLLIPPPSQHPVVRWSVRKVSEGREL